MIASMTGFGRGQVEIDGRSATVEIRTVNGRFCEVSVRSPRDLAEYEGEITRRVKDTLARGRVSVSVQVDAADRPAVGLAVDLEMVRGYRALLDDLRIAAGLDGETVKLEHLLRFQELFTPPSEESDAPALAWVVAQQALDAALEALTAMRRQEGLALRAELLLRAERLEEGLAVVENRVPLRIPEIRDRLRDRLQDLLQDARLDSDRLEQEMAYVADRLDVTEECVRLHSHLALFREALDSPEPVGRKLNFLAQEMNREVNTIGSKANDAEVAHRVVGMKEDLEKIREQVENVE
jgi:uncharacterized protein (TIGR00255 family)